MMGDQENRGLPGQGNARGIPDDEPTLETGSSVAGGGPTSDMEERTQKQTVEAGVPQVQKSGSRLERMTAVRKERRRRLVNRVWLASTPVLLLLVVAVALLSVYGGQDTVSGVDTTNVVTRAAADGSAVLLVKADERLSNAVILEPWGDGGVVLAAPAITLLEVQGVFSTLGQTSEDDGHEAVKAALSGAFGVPLGPVATVDRQRLQAALIAVGIDALPEEVATSVQSEAEAVAEAVRALVSDYAGGGRRALDEADLGGGDVSGFLRAVELDSESMAEDVWTTGALTGRLVEGDGFLYLEPDLEASRSLLVVEAETTVVSVEIRDGAGVEGAARSAGDLLQAAGFILAPMSYAQAYPGVETTQILTSAEDLAYAQEIALALGAGQIIEDDQVLAGQVVVILGRDFGDESAPSTENTE